MHHFFFAGMGSIAVFVLRLLKSTKRVGRILAWVFKVVPSFCVCNGIASASAKAALEKADNETYETLDLRVMGGDLLFLGIHSVVWIFVLVLIEWGFLDCLKPKGTKMTYATGDLNEDKIDDDV